jgi:hypothetical protein
MNPSENMILTVQQYNELTSFVNGAKDNLAKIESFLSTFTSQSAGQQVIQPVIQLNSNNSVEQLVKENEERNAEYDKTADCIKSDKQWYICGNDDDNSISLGWITRRNQMLSGFDISNPTSFQNLLEETKSVVAGGFAVNSLFGFDLSNYTGDMDIFLTKKKWKKDPYTDLEDFKAYFSKIGYALTLDTELRKPYDLSLHYTTPQECPEAQQTVKRVVEAYKSLHQIDRMVVFSKRMDNGIQKDIQVIFTEYDCVRSHIRTFDMSICQTFFDHKDLYIRFKYHHLTLNSVNVLLKKDVNVYEDIKYLKRIAKYQSRGFKTYFDTKNIPFVLNDKTNYLIQYEGINNLLEWKNKDTPVIPLKSLQDRNILYYVRIKPDAILFVNDICNIKYVDYFKQDCIAFKSEPNNLLSEQLVYLVDSNYNILFVEEALIKVKNRMERKYGVSNYKNKNKENIEDIKLVKDPVVYLDEIEQKIKKVNNRSSLNNKDNKINEDKIIFIDLALYAENVFSWLYNPLRLFENTERIGNPFKHKYTELFNTYVDFLQEKLTLFKETDTEYINHTGYTNIQSLIHMNYMDNIFEKIKDIRWLLSLMLVYPDLFKFKQSHYEAAIKNNVARDNLYLIKKELSSTSDSKSTK